MARKYLNKRLPPNASKGQKRLAEVLEELFNSNGICMTIVYEQPLELLSEVDIVSEYEVEGMSVDFYIKELKIAVEYQGQQHYERSSFYGSNIGRDIRKKDFLKDVGVKLIEIPYTMGSDFSAADIRTAIFGER